MADPAIDLHIALLARLKEILSCDVWDAVPQGSTYPYVTIDSNISSPMEFLKLNADTVFVYLGVWSRVTGQAEVIRLMAQIRDAMHEQSLSMGSGQVVSVRVERTRTVRETDNLTFMGQVTLRIITQH